MNSFQIKNIFTVVIITILILLTGNCHGQSQIKKDSSNIKFSTIPVERLEIYKQNKDFYYDKNHSDSGIPWLILIQQFINDLINKIFSKIDADVKTVIFYLIIFLLIIYFAYKIFKSNFSSVMYSGSSKDLATIENGEVDIQSVSPDELIKRAIKVKDYRLAIRIYCIKILKRLAEKEYIAMKPEKTNRQYLSEIKTGTIKEKFENIVKIFEYIWYGNFIYTEKILLEFINTFEDFESTITSEK